MANLSQNSVLINYDAIPTRLVHKIDASVHKPAAFLANQSCPSVQQKPSIPC